MDAGSFDLVALRRTLGEGSVGAAAFGPFKTELVAELGAKVTFTVHEAPGATEAQPATGVAVNEAASVPVTVTPDTTRAASPVLLTVIARAAEVVATFWLPKASPVGAAGVTEATGAGSRLTVVAEPQQLDVADRVDTVVTTLVSTVTLPSAFCGDHVARTAAARTAPCRRLPVGGGREDLADDDDVARVDQAGEHRLLQGHPGGAGPKLPTWAAVIRSVRADLGAGSPGRCGR